MSPKPVKSPSGFPLLCCSTKCPQTCTAQRGTGMRQALALLFAMIFGSKSRVSMASSSLPEKGKSPGREPFLPTLWAAAGRPREAGALAGARWRRAGRGPDWRMAFGIPWNPRGWKEGKSSERNQLERQDSQLQGWCMGRIRKITEYG